MMRRGAQTGEPAATLIGIMTLLFILYILFLPPEERRELLEEENATEDEERTLLDEAPGRLTFTEKTVFDHSVPNVYLSEARNAVVLHQENPFVVYKGWLGEQRKSFMFTIPDLGGSENVILGFQAPAREGVLGIALNGNLIFQSEVQTQNPAPVILPKPLLKSSNQLEFFVTGGFFAGKRYSLADVKVIGELVEVEKQAAESSFTISNTEYDNLERAYIDFFPICEQQEVGILTVKINGKTIHAAAPACESLNREDVGKEDLKSGKNVVSFSIDRGSYRVEQIRLRTILKPVKSYVDYFTVKSSLYNDVKEKDRTIMLEIEFVDDKTLKHAQLNINGKYDVIDQRKPEYERDISKIVREGNNYIELQPLAELNIARITVKAE